MSETEPAADQRLHDAGDAAIDEEEEKAPESGRRPIIAPEAGAEQAGAIRGKLQKLFGISEIPSPDELLQRIEALKVGEGKNKEAARYADIFSSGPTRYVKQIPVMEDGETPGWHCEAIEKDTDRITVAQSQKIADAINSKIDTDLMRKTAAKKRARTERKRARTEKRREDGEVAQSMINTVADIEDLDKLYGVALDAHRIELIKMTGHKKRWQVEILEGKKGSKELVQAINAKKRQLLKIQRAVQQKEEREEKEERTKKRVAGIVRAIREQEDEDQLERYVWSFLVQRLKLVRKRTTPDGADYFVEPLPDVQDSREICDAVDARRAEFKEQIRAKYRK